MLITALCISRLTALDPAFPAFYPDGIVMEHINAKDAEFVDVIHTDAGGYGAPVRTGTADFWPNGGKSVQPGCPRFAPIPLSEDSKFFDSFIKMLKMMYVS